MSVPDRAPYTCRMIGGVLHGEVVVVRSLAPLRTVRHQAVPSGLPSQFVAPVWDGKAPVAGTHDVYEFDGMESAERDGPSYSYKRTVT